MRSINISSSALKSIQLALDTTSNNIANIDTAGFKRRGVAFSELLTDSFDNQPDKDANNRTSPAGLRIGSGVRLGTTKIDLSQGSVKQTDVPTDLMIEGEGYFLVKRRELDVNGNLQEQYRITRNGGFRLSMAGPNKDELYNLVTPSGDILVDGRGQDIEIPQGQPFEIKADGKIYVGGSDTGNTIPVWKVTNPDQYVQVGENEYMVNIPNDEQPINVMEQAPSRLRQGALEMSNVDLNREMTQMILAQRAYQLNARAIGISDQMMSIANGLRSR